MIMGGFFKKIENNPILASPILVITFLLLAIVTIGVLLMMDVMECFLHTLRLHWVEFQNKFFKGEGKKYEAFRFALRESLN